jgi:hypothetical protein
MNFLLDKERKVIAKGLRDERSNAHLLGATANTRSRLNVVQGFPDIAVFKIFPPITLFIIMHQLSNRVHKFTLQIKYFVL